MKHTMLTPTDAIVIPAGFTAPLWITEVNTVLGLGITICIFVYSAFKAVDAFYQWRHRWAKRKLEVKNNQKEG
jgi:hypothetical protein